MILLRMPLHLLGKKSWNVYNPQNIARVRADEAAAAAEEEAREQRLRDYEAERRLALLRGEVPSEIPADVYPLRRGKRSNDNVEPATSSSRGLKRQRRLAGEDDTDRDIRAAREQDEQRRHQRQSGVSAENNYHDLPLTDRVGHIQLFAPSASREKNEEAEREKKRKERELEDQYTMRFSNAAGSRQNIKEMPWYAAQTESHEDTRSGTGSPSGKAVGALFRRDHEDVRKNAFGNDDPNRKGRDEARLRSSDPLASMMKAQKHIQESKRRREETKAARLREFQYGTVEESYLDGQSAWVDERQLRAIDRQFALEKPVDYELDDPANRGRPHHNHGKHRHRHRNRSMSRGPAIHGAKT